VTGILTKAQAAVGAVLVRMPNVATIVVGVIVSIWSGMFRVRCFRRKPDRPMVLHIGEDMFGFQFIPTINIGDLLTVITLVLGFVGAGYSTVRSWRKKAEEDARSGALRFLLRILREKGCPIGLPDLMTEFESPARTALRKAYCEKDWHFQNEAQFEAAVYQLDWEGKIDFVSPHVVIFRLDRPRDTEKFYPSDNDTKQMLTILRNATVDRDVNVWDLREMVDSCMRASPQATSALLREMLHDPDAAVHRHVVEIVGRFVPETPISTG